MVAPPHGCLVLLFGLFSLLHYSLIVGTHQYVQYKHEWKTELEAREKKELEVLKKIREWN